MKKIAALAILALTPAAWAQQNAALSEGGEPCVKVECESGQVANQCPRPVNFARCHAADLGGCLLTETVRIESGEALPFACASGKIARIGGCFPPFIPVSVSGSEHICAPDPKDPEALAAANTQAPQTAPKPAPAAQAPAPAPKPECEMDSLLKAAEKNNSAAARCLIENGAEVNAKTKYGYTSLHRAAREGATEMAAILIENGADVNAKNNNGWTPIDLAIYWEHAEMQSLLSRHGGKAVRFAQTSPKPAQEDNTASARTTQTPQTPAPAPKPKCEMDSLMQAAGKNNIAAARCLIENGADVNAKNRYGWTPLHMAAYSNATETAALLLENGADVNAKDVDDWTSLYYAVRHGTHEMVSLLLENGAEVNAKGGNGWTSLDAAIKTGRAEMQSLLKRHGGRCNAEC